MHADRMDLDAALVGRLIAAQFPQWAHLPIDPVEPGGWDNRTFRLGEHMSVRLPSAARYAAQVEKEHRWLPRLAPLLPLPIPVPLAIGAPAEGYPWPWSVYRWLDGETAAVAPIADLAEFASAVARFLTALQGIDARGGPPPGPHNFFRGGPVATYDAETRRAIATLDGEIDSAAATEVWERALASQWPGSAVWVHGDVSDGNLLVKDGRLAAVIDFGSSGVGDPACDLYLAWTFLEGESREAFRSALPLDEATWARGRGWTLWKGLITLAQHLNTDPVQARQGTPGRRRSAWRPPAEHLSRTTAFGAQRSPTTVIRVARPHFWSSTRSTGRIQILLRRQRERSACVRLPRTLLAGLRFASWIGSTRVQPSEQKAMKEASPIGVSMVAFAVFLFLADVSEAQAPKEAEVSTLVPGTLTVCTYGGFAPVSYKNPEGQLIGLDVSFLTRFAESLGLTMVAREDRFDGIWTLPGANSCDVAGAGVMKRDDRPVGPGGSWSDPYFQVNRSLIVRTADQAAFNDYQTVKGKTIIVTRGSTADKDAKVRYPDCEIRYVDEVVPPDAMADAQGYIVRELIAKNKADAFGEGDVSNNYLRDRYSGDVKGGLAVADVHPIAGATETFNFITRNASTGVLDRLSAFIAKNKGIYAPAP